MLRGSYEETAPVESIVNYVTARAWRMESQRRTVCRQMHAEYAIFRWTCKPLTITSKRQIRLDIHEIFRGYHMSDRKLLHHSVVFTRWNRNGRITLGRVPTSVILSWFLYHRATNIADSNTRCCRVVIQPIKSCFHNPFMAEMDSVHAWMRVNYIYSDTEHIAYIN